MKVALYTRVSTKKQCHGGASLEVQGEYLMQYAKRLGYKVFCGIPGKGIYADEGYSGSNMDRPALKKLLSDARNKRFDRVLVYKQDRLSRKIIDLLSLLREFESFGIGYKSVTELFDTTTTAGKLMIQILEYCAKWER